MSHILHVYDVVLDYVTYFTCICRMSEISSHTLRVYEAGLDLCS